MILELLEYDGAVSNDIAARHYFNELAEFNSVSKILAIQSIIDYSTRMLSSLIQYLCLHFSHIYLLRCQTTGDGCSLRNGGSNED